LIVVHYFGVVQNLSAVRRLADQAHLWLIEDCSHALFGGTVEAPVGAVGDYAIGSTMKFLPIGFGGLLASARRDLADLVLPGPPLREELKAAYNLLESVLEYRRPDLPGPVVQWRIEQPRRSTRNRSTEGLAASGNNDRAQYALDPRWLDRQATWISRVLLRRAATQRLAERRRANFAAYLHAVRGRNDCHPLFDPLPAGTVPQVFPLYVNDCLPVFIGLKRQGVPIIRFGEFLDPRVTAALCPVSIDYADHLLQFPCHQGLTTQEIHWIIRSLIIALDPVSGAR
jgi:perosamine synthetase